MNVQYLQDLQMRLTEYGAIDKQIAELSDKKGIIRNQIEKWIELNNLEEYETRDTEGNIWKISKSSSTRKSIGDWDILQRVLGEKNAHLIVFKEFSTFGIKALKQFSKGWLKDNA